MTYHDSPAFDTYCPPWELPAPKTPPVPNGDDGALFVDPYEQPVV